MGPVKANIIFLGGRGLNLDNWSGKSTSRARGANILFVNSPNLYGAFTSANLPAGLSLVYTNYGVLLVATNTLSGPVLTWPTPASIVYGTALSPSQLDAQASQPGNFTYNVGEGALLGAGTHELFVIYTPSFVRLLSRHERRQPSRYPSAADGHCEQFPHPTRIARSGLDRLLFGPRRGRLGREPWGGARVQHNRRTPHGPRPEHPIAISPGTINDPNYTYTFVPGPDHRADRFLRGHQRKRRQPRHLEPAAASTRSSLTPGRSAAALAPAVIRPDALAIRPIVPFGVLR